MVSDLDPSATHRIGVTNDGKGNPEHSSMLFQWVMPD
jgi:hypothetical protein